MGGGISGLSAGYYAAKRHPIRVYESSHRPGGVIGSIGVEGCVLETGPDSIAAGKPWGLELCRELGLEGDLVPSLPALRTLVFGQRGFYPVPEGFRALDPRAVLSLALGSALSFGGKLRALLDLFLPRGPAVDQTVARFVLRRWGGEVLERLVQPVLAGLWAADPERLSVVSTFPELLELEQRYRSILVGMIRQPRPARTSTPAFYTLRPGLAGLIDRLARALPRGSLRVRAPVSSVRPCPEGWRVAAGPLEEPAAGLILALPAPRSAELVEPFAPGLAVLLRSVPYRTVTTVNMVYAVDQVELPPGAAGLVVARSTGLELLAVTFCHRKYPGRAPLDRALLRCFTRGGGRSRADLVAQIARELGRLLRMRGEPLAVEVGSHPQAVPEYPVGHRERVQRLAEELRRWPGLRIIGNGLEGVDLSDCIRSARLAASSILDGDPGNLTPAGVSS
ncbi:MAG: protoporphyrinogen oxidase [Armatimonadetes bacterium]|nr:protoporphyrinogen oxidase [Armatimonadota bacterium]